MTNVVYILDKISLKCNHFLFLHHHEGRIFFKNIIYRNIWYSKKRKKWSGHLTAAPFDNGININGLWNKCTLRRRFNIRRIIGNNINAFYRLNSLLDKKKKYMW